MIKQCNFPKNEKNEKNSEENCNFPFFGFFCTTGSKNDEKKIKKMIETMKTTRGKLQFFIFWNIFAPLEAKMMKHD